MELRARAVVEGFLSGLHRSPSKGFSVEFAEYREYTPGDDPRDIDWKVYGRTDRYYVKEYEEETNLQCTILLDLSGSMSGTEGKAVAPAKLSKFDYGRFLVASLAYFIFQQRDAIGLLAFDSEARLSIPPKFRPGHLHNLLVELETLQPGIGRDTSMKLIHQVAESMNRKGMAIMVSDFFCDLTELADALDHLRFRGHEVLLFQLMDDHELSFDFTRLTRFAGREGEGMVIGMPQAMKDEYLRNLKAHNDKLHQICGLNRIDYTLLRTSQPLDYALHAYLAARSGKM